MSNKKRNGKQQTEPEPEVVDEARPRTTSLPLFWLSQFNKDGWCGKEDGMCCENCSCGLDKKK